MLHSTIIDLFIDLGQFPRPRAARRWVAPIDQKGAAPIPWAAWALIQILTGKQKPDEILKKINEWKKEGIGRGLYERGKAGRPPKSALDPASHTE